MNELIEYQRAGLPDNLTDLAHFVLFAQEKAKMLQAEIRAIKRLELADAVYQEKLEEQARLRELIAIAGKKVGEFTSALSKDTSFHGNQHVEVASRQRDISKTKGPKRGVRAVDEVAIEYANARQMESHS